MEIGASRRDIDYLHVINYRRAADVVAEGKAEQIDGFNVIPTDVVIAEGLVYLVADPKNRTGSMAPEPAASPARSGH
jgi:nitrous-oxide reductase